MKIALVGNQNSGKSTLFNVLTKKHQKIANFPGATVDIMEGSTYDQSLSLIDLPGIYSLTPYSKEQETTLSFLLHEDYDLILNVVDSTSLERSLYLTTQLLDLNKPMIVVLNMTDRLKDTGLNIHIKTLEKRLGVTFFQVSAHKRTGIKDLLCLIEQNDYIQTKRLGIFPSNIEASIEKITNLIDFDYKRYYALKLLEDETPFMNEVIDEKAYLANAYDEDIYEVFAEARYKFIETLLSYSTSKLTKYDKRTIKIDSILLHKFWAIPIFLLIMFVVYMISVGVVGSFSVGVVEGLIDNFSQWLDGSLLNLGASDWSRSLLIDGLIAGVGAMLAFIPQLVMLFIFINILEASGYMTRIAFFMDKLFKRFGLSGRALIPFILGSGCSVPAIYSTRTIEYKRERDLTAILTPLIPCSAKLPIITLFASMFFGAYAGLVTFLLYVFSIVIIFLSALILKKIMKVKRVGNYIVELPTYKLPNAKYVFRDVLDQVWGFIKHATTIILLTSVVLWFLASFNFRLHYGVDIDQSILAFLGKGLSYLFYPILGTHSWASSIAFLQGLIAKEQVVSSMEVMSGVSGGGPLFSSGLFSFFTVSSAVSFMVFNLYSAPCIASIAAMREELGSAKKALYAVIFQTLMAYAIALVLFWLLRLGGL
ncbi:MAG: ferrous iron transport protein B [Acholeplasmataceae bacterium]